MRSSRRHMAIGRDHLQIINENMITAGLCDKIVFGAAGRGRGRMTNMRIAISGIARVDVRLYVKTNSELSVFRIESCYRQI